MSIFFYKLASDIYLHIQMSIGSHQPIYATNTQYKIWHNQRNTQNLYQYFTIVKPQFHLHRITSQFLFHIQKTTILTTGTETCFLRSEVLKLRCVPLGRRCCFDFVSIFNLKFEISLSWFVVRLFSSGGSP